MNKIKNTLKTVLMRVRECKNKIRTAVMVPALTLMATNTAFADVAAGGGKFDGTVNNLITTIRLPMLFAIACVAAWFIMRKKTAEGITTLLIGSLFAAFVLWPAELGGAMTNFFKDMMQF